MSQKKFYFISFMYGASEKHIFNRVIDVHPLDWQVRSNQVYLGQYTLMSWNEISEEDYYKYVKMI